MSKTVLKIAKELHITKQAIYQRMDAIDNFRIKYTKLVGNHFMVNNTGEKLLKNFEKMDKYNQEGQQEDQKEQQVNEFELLKHQLTVKDAQIEKLLDELTQQQAIYQDALNEIKVLRGRIDQSSREPERHRHWGLWH